jgi:hypothetical protein
MAIGLTMPELKISQWETEDTCRTSVHLNHTVGQAELIRRVDGMYLLKLVGGGVQTWLVLLPEAVQELARRGGVLLEKPEALVEASA